MTWRELSPTQMNSLKNALIIDVRSPCEHEAEFIPESVNIPLLSNEERAIVGTIYAQQGEVSARRQAMRMIAPKIPGILDQILEMHSHGKSIVVHCWRGGLRSEAVASFLSVVGIDCWRLTGGFKSWRREVISEFERDEYPFTTITLHGLTGSGKTQLLESLEANGDQVLDLESLASHRGSVFGGMGLNDQPTQKNFESALWKKLRTLKGGPVFVEGESRKIGKLAVPDFLVKRIHSGTKVLVHSSLESRTRRIMDDYGRSLDSESGHENATNILRSLKERLGAKRIEEIEALASSGRMNEVVSTLLLEYYDPMYQRAIDKLRPYDLEVNSDNLGEATKKLSEFSAAARVTP
jgi:tRNA 2-selenouridine synthase